MTLAVTMEERTPPAAMQLAAQHLVLTLPTFERSAADVAAEPVPHKLKGILQRADSTKLRPARVHSVLSRTSLTVAWGSCNIALLLSNR